MRVWFRNHVAKSRRSGAATAKNDDTESFAAALLKDKKRHRGLQRVEVYQKMYPERVKAALVAAGLIRLQVGIQVMRTTTRTTTRKTTLKPKSR